MQDNRDRRQIDLVANEVAQLGERPTVAAPSLHLLAGLKVGALANAREVFEYDHRAFALCRLHDVFANLVIGLPLESSLSARQPFQEVAASAPRTPRAFRSFALKHASQVAVVVAHALDRFPRPPLAPRGMGNVGASQVNANGLVRRSRGSVGSSLWMWTA